jgi:hypothetical protein
MLNPDDAMLDKVSLRCDRWQGSSTGYEPPPYQCRQTLTTVEGGYTVNRIKKDPPLERVFFYSPT